MSIVGCAKVTSAIPLNLIWDCQRVQGRSLPNFLKISCALRMNSSCRDSIRSHRSTSRTCTDLSIQIWKGSARFTTISPSLSLAIAKTCQFQQKRSHIFSRGTIRRDKVALPKLIWEKSLLLWPRLKWNYLNGSNSNERPQLWMPYRDIKEIFKFCHACFNSRHIYNSN